jgi:nucleotide-binding universal stress UspA family protein
MYEKILIPADGSSTTTQAAEQAFNLAEFCSATVHLLHVVELHRTKAASDVKGSVLSKEALSDREEAGEEAGERLTAALAEDASDRGLDCTTEITTGYAPDAILDYAAAQDIDLIAMGTHGRSGLDRWLHGSVTERVIRQTDVPVYIVRASE